MKILSDYTKDSSIDEQSIPLTPVQLKAQQDAAAQDALIAQILGSSDPTKWQGEGFGSAQANARNMAEILSSIGITDINQFGKVQVQVPDVGWLGSTEDGGYVPLGTTHTEEVWGNTVTGQVLPNTYGERQTGNAWGGTFAGEGSTGYRVQFDAQGNPHFYTTGASSNTLLNILQDNPILNIAANVAAATFGGPAGTALLQAAQGKDIEDIAKAAAISWAGGQLANGVNPEISNAFGGGTTGNIAANAITSGTLAELQGGNFLQGAMQGAVSGGINEAKLAAQQEAFDNAMTESGLAGQTAIDENTFGQDQTVLEPWQQSAYISQLEQELNPIKPSSVEVPTDISGKLAVLDVAKALAPAAIGALTAGAVVNAISDNQPTDSQSTGYPILPIPSNWTAPQYNTAFTPSAPINFGSPEMLRGTQWENPVNLAQLINSLNQKSPETYQLMSKFQAPTVPYETGINDIIGKIGGQSVSIADIISGIQSGQTNPSAVG